LGRALPIGFRVIANVENFGWLQREATRSFLKDPGVRFLGSDLA
jgi:hypothetical protein